MHPNKRNGVNRRDMLKTAAAGVLAVGLRPTTLLGKEKAAKTPGLALQSLHPPRRPRSK